MQGTTTARASSSNALRSLRHALFRACKMTYSRPNLYILFFRNERVNILTMVSSSKIFSSFITSRKKDLEKEKIVCIL
ncbi:unnamed protein product [Amoebophrya sp. A25]|nr:unnamed protein product [Amoebophrya sp. A25]|eukprot:GSA25T00015434001.1